jgi:hypothetical protein
MSDGVSERKVQNARFRTQGSDTSDVKKMGIYIIWGSAVAIVDWDLII